MHVVVVVFAAVVAAVFFAAVAVLLLLLLTVNIHQAISAHEHRGPSDRLDRYLENLSRFFRNTISCRKQSVRHALIPFLFFSMSGIFFSQVDNRPRSYSHSMPLHRVNGTPTGRGRGPRERHRNAATALGRGSKGAQREN